MREIKFRAWEKTKQIMFFVNDIEGLLQYTIFFNKDCSIEIDEYNSELMQFTGIKDKYEKDIYEGDLCNTEDGVCEIVFKYGCFCYLISKEETFCPSFNWHIEELEIVGNIFENPEMLLVTQAIT